MQLVFVLDQNQSPLMPCHPARARELLRKKQACVFRKFPFTILLFNREGGKLQEVELKIDPGSKTTGLCLVGHFQQWRRGLFAAHLHHRGDAIKNLLIQRRGIRRSRRNRHTRYRMPRFNNRRKAEGTLPPSLQSRIDNVKNWALKFSQFCPISKVAVETVRFDMQKIQNPEISGVEYQQGELLGYELREYLLEKWQRQCAYCEIKNVPLEIEHIIPRSRGGSNRLKNLTLACRKCNQKKGNQLLEEWLGNSPTHQKMCEKIQIKAHSSLKDAAAVNSTRVAIGQELKNIFSEVSFWSGGRTKKNRLIQGFPKDHWIDAACVGKSGEKVHLAKIIPLEIYAQSRGSRQMCRVDKFGFPRTTAKSRKRVFDFQTGDLVQVKVVKGKKQGTYAGRVAVRSNGYFNVKTNRETIQGIHHTYCKLIQKVDGYSYTFGDPSKVIPMQKYRSLTIDISIPPRPEGRGLLEILR
jgi:hypothetical protein